MKVINGGGEGQANETARQLKADLSELADACEARVPGSAGNVRAMGANIVRLITELHGEQTNFEAIAAVTRVLLYILDATEKKSMRSTKLRLLPTQLERSPEGNLCAYCGHGSKWHTRSAAPLLENACTHKAFGGICDCLDYTRKEES